MKKQNIALILNIIAFVCGSVGIVFRLMRGVGDFFLYYTQISNVVAVISSAMYIAFRNTENAKLRTFLTCSRYLAACMLTMTFMVVVCIFLPFSAGTAAPRPRPRPRSRAGRGPSCSLRGCSRRRCAPRGGAPRTAARADRRRGTYSAPSPPSLSSLPFDSSPSASFFAS